METEELKSELQKAEALTSHERGKEEMPCSSTMEEFLQRLEDTKRKHSAERRVLVTKLNTAKRELEDLNNELQRKKVVRVQTETEKRLEVVQITEALFQGHRGVFS